MKSYEFKCNDGLIYIKNVDFYSSIYFNKREIWNKHNQYDYFINLYFLKFIHGCEGELTIDRDYDSFEFKNEDDALKVYNDLKQLFEDRE